MSKLELILIIYIVSSQVLAGVVVYLIPRRSKFNTFWSILLALFYPIMIIFSLIDDLINYIKRKKAKNNGL